MFILILLTTLAFVSFFIVRDWILPPRLSAHAIQKGVKAASQQILLGNWEKARSILAPILESDRSGKEACLLHVKVLRGTGALTEALLAVNEAAHLYPEELLFRMEEGLILLDMNRPEDALEAFKLCVPIMRGESDTIALAAALNRAGQANAAFELLEPWLATTQNGELLTLVGDTYFEKKQFGEAIRFYLHAIDLGNKTRAITLQLAQAYRRLGNLAESEKIFRSLLEKDWGDLEATLGLGACAQERGHFQKALLIFQSSGAWERKDPLLMKEAGLCALRTEKYAYAECYLFEVLQKSEPDPLTFSYYALALENQQKWQEAEQVYLRLIQQFPSYPHGYRALAWMFGVGLSRALSQEQGINFAHLALKTKNDPISWEILSACEARVGNFERAYQIQMSLGSKEEAKEIRTRRQQVLRNLRKHHPLDGHQVTRSLVA